MNIVRTQYIEHNVLGSQTEYRIFLSFVFAVKRFLAHWRALAESSFITIFSLIIIFASIVGYVAAINVIMLRGTALRQVQKEVKIIETSVLQKEAALANARTQVSLEKHERIVLMENVSHISFISSNASVADASGYQVIR